MAFSVTALSVTAQKVVSECKGPTSYATMRQISDAVVLHRDVFKHIQKARGYASAEVV